MAVVLAGCQNDSTPPPADGGSSTGSSTGEVVDSTSSDSLDEDDSSSSEADGSSGGEAPILPSEVIAALEVQIEQFRVDAGLPGLAVGFSHGAQVVWTGGFGERGLDTGDAVEPTTPFRLASVSKTVLGVALVRAAELDLLGPEGLDEAVDVGFAVDNPHLDAETITYRDLARHRSGLDDTLFYECSYVSDDGSTYFEPADRVFCPNPPASTLWGFLEEYLRPEGTMYSQDIFAAGKLGEPGATYRYSNVGAALVAAAIDHNSDGFEALCQREIFEPLSMLNTAWHRERLPQPEAAARPHAWVDGAYQEFAPYELATFPDGGLYASADDMTRFLAAMTAGGGTLDGAQVLQPHSAAELLDMQQVDADDVDAQGLFWEEFIGLQGHTGADPGVASAIAYDPLSDVGVVVLINAAGPNTDAVMLQVLQAFQTVAAEHLM